jgi:hypothetical protein
MQMYQSTVRHPLSPEAPSVTDPVDEAMWNLFVAIGPYWSLTDNPEPYRLRFRTFMEDRINFNPIYRDYYEFAAKEINKLIAQYGKEKTYTSIFSGQYTGTPSEPPSWLDLIRLYVSGEFIGMRLAFGGFRDFGAINYCGYFGGANIQSEPVPYRTIEEAGK